MATDRERWIKVTRTIVVEGPESTVRAQLERSYLQPDRPAVLFGLGNGKQQELPRIEVELGRR